MHKILNYFVCSITLIATYNCNAMLETLAAIQTVALAASATSQAVKPLVKEAEHLFGHHKRRRQHMQAAAQEQQAQQKQAAAHNVFLNATKEKLIEKGSEALAEAIVKTISYGAGYTYQALTTQPQQQQPVALAQAEQPQVIVLKIQRQPSQHYHRKNSYSSSQESSSSGESSDNSDSESDSSYRRHRRHSHYHSPYTRAKLSHQHS